jgi:hypothetical protein
VLCAGRQADRRFCTVCRSDGSSYGLFVAVCTSVGNTECVQTCSLLLYTHRVHIQFVYCRPNHSYRLHDQHTILFPLCLYFILVNKVWGRDSSVGTATRYGLDRPGIESRGEIFRTRPDGPWDSPNLLYSEYRVSFPGVKRPGHGGNHPPHLSPRIKKE